MVHGGMLSVVFSADREGGCVRGWMMVTIIVLLVTDGPGLAAPATPRNKAHERLAAMSEIDRSEALAIFVEGSGQPCRTVARTFFQGLDTKGNAIWNVECAGGQSYVVEIKNDRDGSTRVINCRTLYAAGGGTCFK
jgi:hypothetical protein